jgi:hypothetical protein
MAADGHEPSPVATATSAVAAAAVEPLRDHVSTGTWTAPPVAISELQASLRQSMQQLVKDQLAEQRRFMLATFEAFARRLGAEMKENAPKGPALPAAEPLPIEPPPRQWWPVVLTALLAALPAVVLGALYWTAREDNRQVVRHLSELEAKVATLAQATAEAAAAAARAPAPFQPPAAVPGESSAPPDSGGQPAAFAGGPAVAAAPAAPAAVEYVPFGEAPFAGARLERLRQIATPLETQGFRGRILVESYVGDFCLSGSPAAGFAVADPVVPFQKCDLVGNPFEDGLSQAQRQSVDFANFVATLRKRSGGALVVETSSAGRRSPVEYPEQNEGSTAGTWNTVAAQNNRVEFRVVPAS